jgi:hypothetical protein
MHARVRKGASLRNRLVLQTRRPKISQRISAWIVVILILTNIRTKIEDRISSNRARIRRSDIKGPDLRALIGISNIPEDRICSRSSANNILNIQVVKGVRRLKPRTAVIQIQVNRSTAES